MEGLTSIMMSLIASEISNSENEIALPRKELFTEELLSQLYKGSKAHDLAHVVGSGLSRIDPALANGAFQKQVMTAIYRYEQLNYEYESICDTLESARIPFMPLKGSLVRKYYKEPWQRSSCDVDILVKEEALDAAIKVLCDELGYEVKGEKNFHDISLFSESGVHLELHFNILENIDAMDKVLSRVWEYAVLEDGWSYRYTQSVEYLTFHTVAHAAYHFTRGGCGVRPFIDLYLLKTEGKYDEAAVEALCRESGIGGFFRYARDLSQVWFGKEKHSEITEKMEDFILRGGAYGNREGRVAVDQSKTQSKAAYLFFRIFMPYNRLKSKYPVLIKHKWLYPFCLVRRWFELIFMGKVGKSVKELKTANAIGGDSAKETSDLLLILFDNKK